MIEKNEGLKTEEPIKNFSNYFNNLQNQERINDKKANVKEFKKEVKMIIKDAKQSKSSLFFKKKKNFIVKLYRGFKGNK